MKTIYILLIISFANSMYFNTDFGTIVLDEENMFDAPFLGGFNKPKIQWIDWDFDGKIRIGDRLK